MDDEQLDRQALLAQMQAPVTELSPDEEQAFQQWYAGHAKTLGLDPNPDSPLHFYDWRGAFRAGVTPDEAGHWPSTFKHEGHPNLIVDGLDTRDSVPIMSKFAALLRMR